MNTIAEDVFGLSIDFEKSSSDPSRIFISMAGLLDAVEAFDAHMAGLINVKIEPKLILEDIETGSLTTWIANYLKDVDDDALKTGDWKVVVGPFLVKAKSSLLKWLEGNPEIKSKEDLYQIQNDLHAAAVETDVNRIPGYARPNAGNLLSNVLRIKRAAERLSQNDSAKFIYREGNVAINPNIMISEESIEQILTLNTVLSESEVVLKVKQPDYLGFSMWVFRYRDRRIEAKIADEKWLYAFHRKQVPLLPGDSIKAMMKSEVAYGHEGDVIRVHYEVTRVIEVIQSIPFSQVDLLT